MSNTEKPPRDGTYVLVEIPPQMKPIRMLCKNPLVRDLASERDLVRFRYEENTATINILHEVIEILDINNLKVLGIFETRAEGHKEFLVAECGAEEAEIFLEEERRRC